MKEIITEMIFFEITQRNRWLILAEPQVSAEHQCGNAALHYLEFLLQSVGDPVRLNTGLPSSPGANLSVICSRMLKMPKSVIDFNVLKKFVPPRLFEVGVKNFFSLASLAFVPPTFKTVAPPLVSRVGGPE